MINIQAQMKELFGGSCYCYCLARLFGNTEDIKLLTKFVLEGWFNGFIDNDGYVAKPLKYIELICKDKYRDVEKVDINSLTELPKGEWIVCYEYNNNTHFVIANKDGVVFDPSGNSNSVAKGKVKSYRRFIK